MPPFDYRRAVRKGFSHLEKGDRIGPPEEREQDPYDEIFEKIIEELPASTRMYPDVYAWLITDILQQAVQHREDWEARQEDS